MYVHHPDLDSSVLRCRSPFPLQNSLSSVREFYNASRQLRMGRGSFVFPTAFRLGLRFCDGERWRDVNLCGIPVSGLNEKFI